MSAPQLIDLAPFTDASNAEVFAQQYEGELIYVHGLNAWHRWNGRFWEEDKAQRVLLNAEKTIKGLHHAAVNRPSKPQGYDPVLRSANQCHSASRLKAMLTLALAQPELARSPDDINKDPMLLNVANGTIDLRSGQLRKHNPKDLFTYALPVEYDPTAPAIRWEQFLNQVFNGNQDTISYVQRAIGYSLTGSIREQVFFMLYGPGGNGKSTFIETLRTIFKPLMKDTDFCTFQTSYGGNHVSVAELCGKRIVTSSEPDTSRKTDIAFLKKVTGGDPIHGKRLYHNPFEFIPTFKIWFTTNHQLIIEENSHAIWRRVVLIPFNNCFSGSECNPNLLSTLISELPGILKWAVEGAITWNRCGLGSAPNIESATEQYKDEMDTIGDFIQDKCTMGSASRIPVADLYTEYMHWADAIGDIPLDKPTFGKRIRERPDLESKKLGGTQHYLGISIRDN